MITRCIRSIWISLIFFVTVSGYVTANPAAELNSIEATMDFKVTYLSDGKGVPKESITDKSFEPISNARLIVIDRNGHIVANGLTDKNGEWRVKINVPIDPRFQTKSMGIVTVITVADGYNEDIKFTVPVNEHGDRSGKAFIVLRPIRLDARNEPSFDAVFAIHRFTIFRMLDDYANQLGLVKQKQIKGAEGFGEVDMPWSATLK